MLVTDAPLAEVTLWFKLNRSLRTVPPNGTASVVPAPPPDWRELEHDGTSGVGDGDDARDRRVGALAGQRGHRRKPERVGERDVQHGSAGYGHGDRRGVGRADLTVADGRAAGSEAGQGGFR